MHQLINKNLDNIKMHGMTVETKTLNSTYLFSVMTLQGLQKFMNVVQQHVHPEDCERTALHSIISEFESRLALDNR